MSPRLPLPLSVTKSLSTAQSQQQPHTLDTAPHLFECLQCCLCCCFLLHQLSNQQVPLLLSIAWPIITPHTLRMQHSNSQCSTAVLVVACRSQCNGIMLCYLVGTVPLRSVEVSVDCDKSPSPPPTHPQRKKHAELQLTSACTVTLPEICPPAGENTVCSHRFYCSGCADMVLHACT
jgi:hypothetical protein